MKLIWAIFAFYIFSLSAIPCGDVLTCNEFSENHKTECGSGNETEDHEEEVCTPFCICTCCGCPSIKTEPPVTFSIAVTQPSEKKLIPYQTEILSQFTAKIWQPPKIA
ncbi:MAG: hypothetical protein IAF38_07740 [Bacteroidia bacterium]|nr:hypothetical protein [Bacteroidia bacterium]